MINYLKIAEISRFIVWEIMQHVYFYKYNIE